MRNMRRDKRMLLLEIEQTLLALEREREQVRFHLREAPSPPRWEELERRAGVASLVGRKATPAARRMVEGALAAVRAFHAGLPVRAGPLLTSVLR